MTHPLKSVFNKVLPVHTLNRDLKILFVSNLFASFGDGLFIYLLPLFIRDLNASPENVGLLFSILTVASAITMIPGGLLADRYDRKKILLLGWAIWVPVPLFFVFATNWNQLIPAMFLYGVLFSSPASSAYIVGRTEKKKVASTFATLVSAWGIGYTFAPTVSGYLSEAIGMQSVFYLTSIFYFITTVTTTLISSQHPREDKRDSKIQQTTNSPVVNRWKIVSFSVLFASIMFILSLIFPLVPQFLRDIYKYETTLIGILGSFTYFGGAILSLLIGKIGDKYGKTTSISVSMISVAFALLLFTSFNSIPILILASFIRGASFPMWAFIGATIGSIVPSVSRARWISVVQTITQAVSIFAPLVGGILYAHSPQTPFLIAIATALIISILAQSKPFKEK